jgi:hypothetical protein
MTFNSDHHRSCAGRGIEREVSSSTSAMKGPKHGTLAHLQYADDSSRLSSQVNIDQGASFAAASRHPSRQVEIGGRCVAVRFTRASRLQPVLARRFAIVSREQFGPCRTVFD